MFKILYIFFFALVVSNCSFKKVVKHHGVPFLDKKQKQLIVDKSTSNDVRKILGTPSTRSKFDNDIWIYIERKQTQSKLTNLGRMKILENNVGKINYEIKGRDEFRPKRGTLGIKKAKKIIKYSPKYPLELGIKKYLKFFLHSLEVVKLS